MLPDFAHPDYDPYFAPPPLAGPQSPATIAQNQLLERLLALYACLCPGALIAALALFAPPIGWVQYLYAFSATLLFSGVFAIHIYESVTHHHRGLLSARFYSFHAAKAAERLRRRAHAKITTPLAADLVQKIDQIHAQTTNLSQENRGLSLAINDAKTTSEDADTLTHQAADRAHSLAESIAATTTHIANAANIAASLANTAFAAARTITVIESRLAPLNEAIATLDMLLTRAAATLPLESESPSAMALTNQVAALGRAGLTALAQLKSMLADMREDAQIATLRCEEIAHIVRLQHKTGEDLSLNVLAQSEEIASIARFLENTRGGVAQLRRQVELVAKRQSQNETAIRELSESVRVLPDHANEIVNLLTQNETIHSNHHSG